jgi:Fe-S-cluster containining protein
VDTPPPAADDQITATIALTILGERFDAQVTVPSGNTSCSRLLPVFRALADAIVGVGVEQCAREGKTVSCRRGCGACCRQLVPISGTEAREIRTLVRELPEPRRTEVEGRYRAARERLDGAGLSEPLLSSRPFEPGEAERLGLAYFHLGIACPFLEDEACSIYEDRPIACHEYLVTSDPAHCARPSAETVECVPVASRVSTALSRVGRGPEQTGRAWVPLIAALDWAEQNPEEPSRPGPVLLRELIEELTSPSRNTSADTPPPG